MLNDQDWRGIATAAVVRKPVFLIKSRRRCRARSKHGRITAKAKVAHTMHDDFYSRSRKKKKHELSLLHGKKERKK
jgi:hypothetical protein